MEALEFLKETDRMCSSYTECSDCPLKELASFSGYPTCRVVMFKECEKAISAVDAWSREHPIITNAQKFKEVFGRKPRLCCEELNCNVCIEWWNEPYKEPKGGGDNG